MNRKSDPIHRPSPAGFTLIELMVSIALVLILILGINQVFKIASDTVNVGQAMSGAAREDRAIQGTLGPDVQNMVLADAPFFIIRSRVQPAFRSRADEQADRDGDPYTIDIDGNNKEGEANVPGEKIGALTYTSRNHRLDRLLFFSNYHYRRQTGATPTQLISDMSSNEAYLWYGHLSLGRNNPKTINDYFRPGEADASAAIKNDNNRYATDWTLGRVVTLLSETPLGVPIPGRLLRNGKGLTPLAESSQSEDGRFIHESRYDVANTSMSKFRGYLSLPLENWKNQPWWESLSIFRFQAYPYPTRPLNGDSMARTVPIFVRGCTQFIVEYAGDYLAQDELGMIRGTAFSNPPSTDGVIDYVVVNGARRTRWYGAPRNVDTSDDVGGPMIAGTGPANKMLDVVPLRDVLKSNGVSGVTIDPVNFIEPEIDRRLPSKPNYAAIAGTPVRQAGGSFTSPVMGNGAPKTGDEYVAAWGPSATGTYEHLARGSRFMPKMLRITIVVDDPAGRLTEGQTYEYVFKLPG